MTAARIHDRSLHDDPQTTDKVVLLASGGLDSTVLAYWLEVRGADVEPLFLHYGQHCAETELATLRAVLPSEMSDRTHVAHLGDVLSGSRSRLIREANLWRDHIVADDLVIPYRNLFLLAAGAAFAAARGRTALYSAFINSNHAREIDATRAFLDGLSALFSSVGSVEVRMPFREYSKAEVAKLGVALGAPVALTYSCQVSSQIHCGACPNCVDRLEALRAASVDDSHDSGSIIA